MDLSHRALLGQPVARPRRERLTVGLACALNWGPPRRLVGGFRRQHPQIELVLEDLDETDLDARLAHRRIDLAIAPLGAGARGWRSTPLWSEPLMVFMAESHPLAAGNAVEPQELRGIPLLLAGSGAGDRALQAAIVKAIGGPPNFLHYAVQRDNLIDLVSLGFGVTLAGGSALGAFYPGIVARPLESETAWLTYCALWSRDNERPALRRFLEFGRDA